MDSPDFLGHFDSLADADTSTRADAAEQIVNLLADRGSSGGSDDDPTAGGGESGLSAANAGHNSVAFKGRKTLVFRMKARPDIEYTVNRLLSGLVSGQDFLSAGSATALALLIPKFRDDLSIPDVLRGVFSATNFRDCLLADKTRHMTGRVMGILAVHRSGFFRTSGSLTEIDSVFATLWDIHDQSLPLQELATHAMYLLVADLYNVSPAVAIRGVADRLTKLYETSTAANFKLWLAAHSSSSPSSLDASSPSAAPPSKNKRGGRGRGKQSNGIASDQGRTPKQLKPWQCPCSVAGLALKLRLMLIQKEAVAGGMVNKASMKHNAWNTIRDPLSAQRLQILSHYLAGTFVALPRLHGMWESIFALIFKDPAMFGAESSSAAFVALWDSIDRDYFDLSSPLLAAGGADSGATLVQGTDAMAVVANAEQSSEPSAPQKVAGGLKDFRTKILFVGMRVALASLHLVKGLSLAASVEKDAQHSLAEAGLPVLSKKEANMCLAGLCGPHRRWPQAVVKSANDHQHPLNHFALVFLDSFEVVFSGSRLTNSESQTRSMSDAGGMDASEAVDASHLCFLSFCATSSGAEATCSSSLSAGQATAATFFRNVLGSPMKVPAAIRDGLHANMCSGMLSSTESVVGSASNSKIVKRTWNICFGTSDLSAQTKLMTERANAMCLAAAEGVTESVSDGTPRNTERELLLLLNHLSYISDQCLRKLSVVASASARKDSGGDQREQQLSAADVTNVDEMANLLDADRSCAQSVGAALKQVLLGSLLRCCFSFKKKGGDGAMSAAGSIVGIPTSALFSQDDSSTPADCSAVPVWVVGNSSSESVATDVKLQSLVSQSLTHAVIAISAMVRNAGSGHHHKSQKVVDVSTEGPESSGLSPAEFEKLIMLSRQVVEVVATALQGMTSLAVGKKFISADGSKKFSAELCAEEAGLGIEGLEVCAGLAKCCAALLKKKVLEMVHTECGAHVSDWVGMVSAIALLTAYPATVVMSRRATGGKSSSTAARNDSKEEDVVMDEGSSTSQVNKDGKTSNAAEGLTGDERLKRGRAEVDEEINQERRMRRDHEIREEMSEFLSTLTEIRAVVDQLPKKLKGIRHSRAKLIKKSSNATSHDDPSAVVRDALTDMASAAASLGLAVHHSDAQKLRNSVCWILWKMASRFPGAGGVALKIAQQAAAAAAKGDELVDDDDTLDNEVDDTADDDSDSSSDGGTDDDDDDDDQADDEGLSFAGLKERDAANQEDESESSTASSADEIEEEKADVKMADDGSDDDSDMDSGDESGEDDNEEDGNGEKKSSREIVDVVLKDASAVAGVLMDNEAEGGRSGAEKIAEAAIASLYRQRRTKEEEKKEKKRIAAERAIFIKRCLEYLTHWVKVSGDAIAAPLAASSTESSTDMAFPMEQRLRSAAQCAEVTSVLFAGFRAAIVSEGSRSSGGGLISSTHKSCLETFCKNLRIATQKMVERLHELRDLPDSDDVGKENTGKQNEEDVVMQPMNNQVSQSGDAEDEDDDKAFRSDCCSAAVDKIRKAAASVLSECRETLPAPRVKSLIHSRFHQVGCVSVTAILSVESAIFAASKHLYGDHHLNASLLASASREVVESQLMADRASAVSGTEPPPVKSEEVLCARTGCLAADLLSTALWSWISRKRPAMSGHFFRQLVDPSQKVAAPPLAFFLAATAARQLFVTRECAVMGGSVVRNIAKQILDFCDSPDPARVFHARSAWRAAMALDAPPGIQASMAVWLAECSKSVQGLLPGGMEKLGCSTAETLREKAAALSSSSDKKPVADAERTEVARLTFWFLMQLNCSTAVACLVSSMREQGATTEEELTEDDTPGSVGRAGSSFTSTKQLTVFQLALIRALTPLYKLMNALTSVPTPPWSSVFVGLDVVEVVEFFAATRLALGSNKPRPGVARHAHVALVAFLDAALR